MFFAEILVIVTESVSPTVGRTAAVAVPGKEAGVSGGIDRSLAPGIHHTFVIGDTAAVQTEYTPFRQTAAVADLPQQEHRLSIQLDIRHRKRGVFGNDFSKFSRPEIAAAEFFQQIKGGKINISAQSDLFIAGFDHDFGSGSFVVKNNCGKFRIMLIDHLEISAGDLVKMVFQLRRPETEFAVRNDDLRKRFAVFGEFECRFQHRSFFVDRLIFESSVIFDISGFAEGNGSP